MDIDKDLSNMDRKIRKMKIAAEDLNQLTKQDIIDTMCIVMDEWTIVRRLIREMEKEIKLQQLEIKNLRDDLYLLA